MKMLVSGSHGVVGSALVRSLSNNGHEVYRLVRRVGEVSSSDIGWDPERELIDVTKLEGLDVVVHLAGESIADGRWSEEKKRKIGDSRINGTKLLSNCLEKLSRPPATFICASAIGIYGNRGNEVLVEGSAPGKGFLATVCLEWEQATRPAAEKGIRTINARFGIILDKEGGALAKMLPPFRMGVGGRIGNGGQWMSWIALADVVRGIEHTITSPTAVGPINFVSPYPVTNSEFTKTLGRVLSRPTVFPIPAFGVRLAFGEMADALLLASQRVLPARLTSIQFEFQYPQLESALRSILR